MIVPIAIKDEKPIKGGRQRWRCYLIIPNMVDFFPIKMWYSLFGISFPRDYIGPDLLDLS